MSLGRRDCCANVGGKIKGALHEMGIECITFAMYTMFTCTSEATCTLTQTQTCPGYVPACIGNGAGTGNLQPALT
ncbi:unnamed protein product [Protopolystoma xenopodis]|uniref:Uncharacterized protein n=1 Tax=Protopolystoma xenopodis TaxID=117903 RepID=A0A448XB32_9PLAT|nr:unnamed protein product [Protopolystoma xenopodis]